MAEVSGLRKKVDAEVYGEPDGFDTHRSVRFDPATAEWLDPLLTLVDDRRISEHRVTSTGNLIVDFVGDSASESRGPFLLAEAEKALTKEEPEPAPAAKKAAAKRVAKKAQ